MVSPGRVIYMFGHRWLPYFDMFLEVCRKTGCFEVLDVPGRREAVKLIVSTVFRRYDILCLNFVEDYCVSRRTGMRRPWVLVLLRWIVRLNQWRGREIWWILHNKRTHFARSDAESDPAMQYLFRVASCVIVHSSYAAKYAEQRFGVSEKVFLLPLPGFTEQYQPRPKTPSEEVRVLFFGGISGYKRVERLIECVRRAANASVRLEIVGRCDERLYRVELENAAKGDSRIGFRFGLVPNEEVPGVFANADVVILRQDGGSVLTSGVFMLALSMATVVVAPRVAMFSDFEGREYVKLYGSEDELVSWLRTLRREDVPLLHRQGWEAYKTMASESRWEDNVRRLREWYNGRRRDGQGLRFAIDSTVDCGKGGVE